MGETAVTEVDSGGDVQLSRDVSQEPDPMVFNVGEEEDKPEEVAEEKQEAAETPDYGKQISELSAKNEELQKQLNRKFYNLRKERKEEKKAEPDDTVLTDPQLLKIMQENRDEPTVLFQVFKQMTKQAAEKTKKEAVEDTTISQQKAQAEQWMKQNIPQLFEPDSELREKTDEILTTLRLTDHPLGDFLAVAAAQVTAIPELLRQAREDERKKVLAEANETSRKTDIRGAAPAGSARPVAGGKADEAGFRASGKAMGLTGGALDLYVQMRKNAKNSQRTVQEA